MMHLPKLEKQTIEALEALGFTIADNKESAEVADYIRIVATRPSDNPGGEVLLQITMPNGDKLNIRLERAPRSNAR